jgi:predicted nuclease of restriction endonuclease-like (RecB) superfamily
VTALTKNYEATLAEVIELLESARRAAARSVNAIMTATYWEIGRHIVEYEQSGQERAEYGTALLKRLSDDLTAKFGKGFSKPNLEKMRRFYLGWSIASTLSMQSDESLPTKQTDFYTLTNRFQLPWSHYVRLLSVKDTDARAFYEKEALRGGWSERQLKRQIESLFYERTASSKNKVAMLQKGAKPTPEDITTSEEELKSPYILDFLDLKDEYSERDLEEALIGKLQSFLLELGSEFAFISRQHRLRIGDEWFRIDLLFFHRVLRCVVIIDLKLGKLTHADVGQMHMYINYAHEHLTYPGENSPVGLILCSQKDEAVAHYALGGLPNILAAEYQLKLPNKDILTTEIEQARKILESRILNNQDSEI